MLKCAEYIRIASEKSATKADVSSGESSLCIMPISRGLDEMKRDVRDLIFG